DIAGVPHDQVGPPDRDIGAAQGRQDLLVDPVGPADLRAEREQPDVIHDGDPHAAVGPLVAGAAHHVGGLTAGMARPLLLTRLTKSAACLSAVADHSLRGSYGPMYERRSLWPSSGPDAASC